MKDNFEYFQLSELEGRNARTLIAKALGWIALGALVVSTGVHAVSLVISQIGLGHGALALVRVGSPVLVEIIAAIVALGFASHSWRGPQKPVGLVVELLWLAFAALNLVTSFTLESGGEVGGLLLAWLHYGLPLSALLAGALFYAVMRLDPEHRRQAELQATGEVHRMAEFAARREVLVSPQMAAILRQRGWLAVVADLERQGYSSSQIAFMLEGVPQLQSLNHAPPPSPQPPTLPLPTTPETVHSANGKEPATPFLA